MMHPQASRVAALWALDPSVIDPGFDIATARETARTAAADEPRDEVESVQDLDAGGVPCRLYRPAPEVPVIVHLHGGGFVFGDLETHDAHSRRLANSSGRAVLSVDYRRAPEHAYPAASDDVDTVVDWLRHRGPSLGLEAGRISVVGDSSGGQLALVAALRRPGTFESAVLVYPCIDPSGSHPSYLTESGGLSSQEMDWYWDAYVPDDRMRTNSELTPLGADLSLLPPTLVITAEHDPLRDEGEALAAGIANAGVCSVATRYLGMIHGFFRHPALFDAGAQAMGQAVAFIRRPTGVAGASDT